MALSSYRNYIAEGKRNFLLAIASTPDTKRNVAFCLFRIGQPRKALTWIFEAMELFEQRMDPIASKVMCLDIISSCYRAIGYIAQAELYQSRKSEKLSGQPYNPQNPAKYWSGLFLNPSCKVDGDATCSLAYTHNAIRFTRFKILNCKVTKPRPPHEQKSNKKLRVNKNWVRAASQTISWLNAHFVFFFFWMISYSV